MVQHDFLKLWYRGEGTEERPSPSHQIFLHPHANVAAATLADYGNVDRCLMNAKVFWRAFTSLSSAVASSHFIAVSKFTYGRDADVKEPVLAADLLANAFGFLVNFSENLRVRVAGCRVPYGLFHHGLYFGRNEGVFHFLIFAESTEKFNG
jgi:hypothetical protein